MSSNKLLTFLNLCGRYSNLVALFHAKAEQCKYVEPTEPGSFLWWAEREARLERVKAEPNQTLIDDLTAFAQALRADGHQPIDANLETIQTILSAWEAHLGILTTVQDRAACGDWPQPETADDYLFWVEAEAQTQEEQINGLSGMELDATIQYTGHLRQMAAQLRALGVKPSPAPWSEVANENPLFNRVAELEAALLDALERLVDLGASDCECDNTHEQNGTECCLCQYRRVLRIKTHDTLPACPHCGDLSQGKKGYLDNGLAVCRNCNSTFEPMLIGEWVLSKKWLEHELKASPPPTWDGTFPGPLVA